MLFPEIASGEICLCALYRPMGIALLLGDVPVMTALIDVGS